MAVTEDEWTERFGRQVAAALGEPQRVYRRPGSALLMNDEWWELYDRIEALNAGSARHGYRAQIGGGTGWARRLVLL